MLLLLLSVCFIMGKNERRDGFLKSCLLFYLLVRYQFLVLLSAAAAALSPPFYTHNDTKAWYISIINYSD
jgi:hypothetical protein